MEIVIFKINIYVEMLYKFKDIKNMLLCFILFVSLSDACMFYTAHNRIFLEGIITEEHTVTDFQGGCELMCYYASDRCIAANVVPNVDGTYSCQFVDGNIKNLEYLALTESYGAKYISSNHGMYLEYNIDEIDKCQIITI